MSTQLEQRSLTELRAMAAAVGVTVSFADTKSALIKAIRAQVDAKASKPLPFAPIGVTPHEGSSQMNVMNALRTLIDRGLIVTFPTHDTWHCERNKKVDSGNINMPLLSIVRCAEAVSK